MTTPFRPAQLSPAMVERYGINRRSLTGRIVTYTLAVAFALILGFVAYQVTRPSVDFTLVSWKVMAPDRVDVTFRVHAPSDEPIPCVIRAQDASRADVGYATTEVTPVDGATTVTYRLRTAIPAYAAEVLGCGSSAVPGPQFPVGVVPPAQPWAP